MPVSGSIQAEGIFWSPLMAFVGSYLTAGKRPWSEQRHSQTDIQKAKQAADAPAPSRRRNKPSDQNNTIGAVTMMYYRDVARTKHRSDFRYAEESIWTLDDENLL